MAKSKRTLQVVKKKTGRPWKDLGSKRYRHALGAQREVESLVTNGKTYDKARTEVSKKRGIGKHTLSRDKKLAASLDIMANQPMGLWRSLGHVLEGANPFRQAPKRYSLDTQILPAVKAIFDTMKVTKISSNDLVAVLAAYGAPWDTSNSGKPISTHQLGYKLSKFGILSMKIRLPSGPQNGYHLIQFHDAFERYLPRPSVISGTFALE